MQRWPWVRVVLQLWQGQLIEGAQAGVTFVPADNTHIWSWKRQTAAALENDTWEMVHCDARWDRNISCLAVNLLTSAGKPQTKSEAGQCVENMSTKFLILLVMFQWNIVPPFTCLSLSTMPSAQITVSCYLTTTLAFNWSQKHPTAQTSASLSINGGGDL